MTWFVQARCYVDWSLLLCKILASLAMQQPVPAELGRKPRATGRSVTSKMGKEAVFFLYSVPWGREPTCLHSIWNKAYKGTENTFKTWNSGLKNEEESLHKNMSPSLLSASGSKNSEQNGTR